MDNIKFETTKGGWIDDEEIVTVKKYTHMVEIQNNPNKQSHLGDYKKKNSKSCINEVTGELIGYKLNEGKVLKWVKREISDAKDILINNFYGHQNVLFITLTYDNPTMDFEKVKKNFRNFYNKLQRRYGKLIYFHVIELQKDRWEIKQQKSLHIHLAIKDIKNKRFSVDNDEIYDLWKEGWTETKRLKTVNKIASYFFKDFVSEENLKIYPKYKRIFNSTLGLKGATIESCSMKEFLERYSDELYRENAVMINIIDEKTGKIMRNYKRQSYMPRKYKRKTKRKYKLKRAVRFIKIEADKMVCDDIYTFKYKKCKKAYGIKITLDTKNTVLMDKVKKLKKNKKQWILLESTFPVGYGLSNVKVIDILDENDVTKNHLF